MLLKRPASAVLKRPAALLKRPAALSMTTDSSRRFTPHPSTRIVAVGSGADGMGQPIIADTIVALSGKEKPCVLYLGTATYDLETPQIKQTESFASRGCRIIALRVADATPSHKEIDEAFAAAEVIIMSGGNRLFATDRQTRLGIHERLRSAMERGVVLAGGSAGAICWFDSGHSDSMDPTSYKRAKLGSGDWANDHEDVNGEATAAWKYIRVPGFGFLPGLCCPHHDKIQDNGILRADDVDGMLLRHNLETAICLDHWAALVIEGVKYRIVYPEGKEGSVCGYGKSAVFSRERQGRPGVWKKYVDRILGTVTSQLVAAEGDVRDLLVRGTCRVDPLVEVARRENPDDLP